MKRVILALLAAIAALAAVVAVRTVRFRPRVFDVIPAARVTVLPGAADRLAAAIRIPTISHGDSLLRDSAAFRQIREELAASFPKAHAAMTREIIGEGALLFTWPGTDPSLPPILLMGHLDVVPVEPGSESSWRQPPFSGAIADGAIWGRGAMDNKSTVLGIMEAVEGLLTDGYQPRRTVLVSFGADEEVGGRKGAAVVARLLQSRGIKPFFVLDEGGMVVQGAFPGITKPVAVVGIAEKGYLTLELSARGSGGHSSVPPRQTSAGILARAITRLEDKPFPGEIRGATASLFDAIGRESSLPMRAMLANRWLLDPVLEWKLGSIPRSNATIRTTTAVTMLEGSPKDNVLPGVAKARVNFRLMPGDNAEWVIDRVKKVIDDERVTVSRWGFESVASLESSTSDSAWTLLDRSIRQGYPGSVVAPYLVVAATDSRHFRELSANVYRFAAMRADTSDAARVHGTNERVSIDGYLEGIRFLATLIRNSTK
jgi:carboxypeptidase PM20D1